jgi:hypothetical protein
MKPYPLTTRRQQELRLRLSLAFVKPQGVFDFRTNTDEGSGATRKSNAFIDTVYFFSENGLVHEVDRKPFITNKGKRLLRGLHLVARPSKLDSSVAHRQ